ncbi:pseudouridine synthase [Mesorhizobium sp. M2A.F.Ca.ET.037.01.1.1]|uniref:pseudouridine synthase n=1 Tax=unclassified Mesorhizobium TaxID=325217 RepID=UPI000F7631B5|nr:MULTISPECIES: pseudouridine synthase [unclassified Mesorhizobium]RVC71174.1 pseudouridine synthase [Mesorhizobium sp. M00.F.Ca.ET.038.03.1.1]AZO34491.1 rRNA pseudouridine synthase [Mesorhizobium sp. M2A.F.Ca.ET.046.03.2.1]RUX03827.1 pseudouridine synthase [Mesorhizobium sp. M2A.F.Ca.ET.037.01.1.1]RWA90208.1 MAG: pseudouridine synthase [Mesorhizobium sp.]RWB38519.1 MAG: pseudouridine synthase [Mesorhizobium sp.]
MTSKPLGQPSKAARRSTAGKVSLNRALSKLGFCSRKQAELLIGKGRVRVGGKVARDPALWVDPERESITVDGERIAAERKVYLMLNKPRGLVTTRDDPEGRGTVYDCLKGLDLPFVSPVGRLDKASEGLLLMSNDTRWASGLLDPASHVAKTYHVQIAAMPDEAMLERFRQGAVVDGELLTASSIALLRSGGRTAWLEIVLDEGRNRQIRRLLGAFDIEVLRLVRVAIGGLQLGELAKGKARHLTSEELATLAT